VSSILSYYLVTVEKAAGESRERQIGPVQFESCDASGQQFPARRERARPSIETRNLELQPRTICRADRALARMLAFQHRELLAEGEVFQQQAATSARDAIQGSEPESKKFKHSAKVIADPKAPGLALLLISKAGGIVTSHTLHPSRGHLRTRFALSGIGWH
jgi:hypothetical protein